MAELILETPDKFSVMYDILSGLSEATLTELELASSLRLSPRVVHTMLSLMLSERFLKTGPSESEFRLTSQGFDFLEEFAGIRKFVG
jgi:predicted transcriptional regulator